MEYNKIVKQSLIYFAICCVYFYFGKNTGSIFTRILIAMNTLFDSRELCVFRA